MNHLLKRIGMLAAVLTASLAASAYDFEDNGLAYNVTDEAAKTVEVTSIEGEKYSGDITVPASVSYNGEQYSVTSIGWYAFYGCSGLTSITLPSAITSIGNYAFNLCTGLTSITLPSSLTSLGFSVFENCTGLKSIEVEKDNQTYSSLNGILYNKQQTTVIYCPAGKTGEIILPSSVASIGGYAFYGCTGLTSIGVESDNQSFSSLNGILYDKAQTTLVCCPAGKSGEVTLPNSVISIDMGAFDSCTGLTSIILPSSLTSIGDEAFACCRKLTSITSLAVTPPKCGVYEPSFYLVHTQNCTLYVPAESVDAYKQAPEWKDFGIITGVSGIDAVEADTTAKTQVFNLNGTRATDSLDNLPAGIYIVRQGTASKKIIIR